MSDPNQISDRTEEMDEDTFVELLTRFLSKEWAEKHRLEAEEDVRTEKLQDELGIMVEALAATDRVYKKRPTRLIERAGVVYGILYERHKELIRMHTQSVRTVVFPEPPQQSRLEEEGMTDRPNSHLEDTVARCFKIAQRAIDDLRRYMYDNTRDRRLQRAQRLQADLDAFAVSVGHEHVHQWPRDLWAAEGADASLETLERDAKGALALLDASYDSSMDPVVRTAVFRSQDVIRRLVEDARLSRGKIRQIETDLLLEEQESHHWAGKAVVDGDLGRNPPTFLVDVVEELRKEIEALKEGREA
jgi:hypothetical protein